MGREVLGRPGVAALDGTKLVVDVRGTGLSGYAADTWLRERHHITVEMSDHRRIVALLSIADDDESVGRLLAALGELAHAGPGTPGFRIQRQIAGGCAWLRKPWTTPRLMKTTRQTPARTQAFLPTRA